MMARADDGQVMQFWRDAVTLQWNGPQPVP
jgi:hypothetical protein